MPLVFLPQAAQRQVELEPREQLTLQSELAERRAPEPASEAQEEQLRASLQPEEPLALAAELPQLPSSA